MITMIAGSAQQVTFSVISTSADFKETTSKAETFPVDHVFDQSKSNKGVFDTLGPMISVMLEGCHLCLMATGQTTTENYQMSTLGSGPLAHSPNRRAPPHRSAQISRHIAAVSSRLDLGPPVNTAGGHIYHNRPARVQALSAIPTQEHPAIISE